MPLGLCRRTVCSLWNSWTFHWSHEHIIHCKLPMVYCKWGIPQSIQMSHTHNRQHRLVCSPCLIPHWHSHSHQVRIVKQSSVVWELDRASFLSMAEQGVSQRERIYMFMCNIFSHWLVGGPGLFSVWLRKASANERKSSICSIISHWPIPCLCQCLLCLFPLFNGPLFNGQCFNLPIN